MLYRVQLLRVRRRNVASAARGRALRRIFDLRPGQRLGHLLLVFALILNLDIGGRAVYVWRRALRLPTVVVVDFADLVHALVLRHVQRLV